MAELVTKLKETTDFVNFIVLYINETINAINKKIFANIENVLQPKDSAKLLTNIIIFYESYNLLVVKSTVLWHFRKTLKPLITKKKDYDKYLVQWKKILQEIHEEVSTIANTLSYFSKLYTKKKRQDTMSLENVLEKLKSYNVKLKQNMSAYSSYGTVSIKVGGNGISEIWVCNTRSSIIDEHNIQYKIMYNAYKDKKFGVFTEEEYVEEIMYSVYNKMTHVHENKSTHEIMFDVLEPNKLLTAQYSYAIAVFNSLQKYVDDLDKDTPKTYEDIQELYEPTTAHMALDVYTLTRRMINLIKKLYVLDNLILYNSAIAEFENINKSCNRDNFPRLIKDINENLTEYSAPERSLLKHDILKHLCVQIPDIRDIPQFEPESGHSGEVLLRNMRKWIDMETKYIPYFNGLEKQYNNMAVSVAAAIECINKLMLTDNLYNINRVKLIMQLECLNILSKKRFNDENIIDEVEKINQKADDYNIYKRLYNSGEYVNTEHAGIKHADIYNMAQLLNNHPFNNKHPIAAAQGAIDTYNKTSK